MMKIRGRVRVLRRTLGPVDIRQLPGQGGADRGKVPRAPMRGSTPRPAPDSPVSGETGCVCRVWREPGKQHPHAAVQSAATIGGHASATSTVRCLVPTARRCPRCCGDRGSGLRRRGIGRRHLRHAHAAKESAPANSMCDIWSTPRSRPPEARSRAAGRHPLARGPLRRRSGSTHRRAGSSSQRGIDRAA
jgi:hypothetical protein